MVRCYARGSRSGSAYSQNFRHHALDRHMANAPASDALTEARKPLRAYVLRRLLELQTGTPHGKPIPLTEIMNNSEFANYKLRMALRDLYRVGLIKSGGGGYRATQMGQHIYSLLHPPYE